MILLYQQFNLSGPGCILSSEHVERRLAGRSSLPLTDPKIVN
jgi:hypothetical protein